MPRIVCNPEQIETDLGRRLACLAELCTHLAGSETARLLHTRIGSSMADTLRVLYPYAVNGVSEVAPDQLNTAIARGIAFLQWLPVLHPAPESPRATDSPLAWLLRLVQARKLLEDDQPLSIAALALLAGLSEKTIRNAISMKGPGRLKTQRSHNGPVIAAAEARRFLSLRETLSDRRQQPDAFVTLEDFGAFVREHRLARRLSVQEVAVALGWEITEGGLVEEIEAGVRIPSLELAMALARILSIDAVLLARKLLPLLASQPASVA